ncbi:MAG: 3'-5' exonuclease [Acidobacteriaceae bacterium]
MQHGTINDEIETVADYVDWYIRSHPGMAAGEVLVLANRRAIGNGIKDALNSRAQQRNRTWSAESFYLEDALNSSSAAEAFSLLSLLVDPEDRPALRYWIGEGRQDCRRLPYARVRQYCEGSGLSPRDAFEALTTGHHSLPYTTDVVARYEALKQRLASLQPLSMPQLVNALFPDGIPEVSALRQAALLIAPTIQTPLDLLNELRSDITQPELPGTQGSSIRIMSLHKSKGLTARLVIIAGCVSGVLPSIDFSAPIAEQNRQWQEQRRLFYVGLTRSTETLVMSSAVRMQRKAAMQMGMLVPSGNPNGMASLPASPFLSELGPSAPAAVSGNVWRANLGF